MPPKLVGAFLNETGWDDEFRAIVYGRHAHTNECLTPSHDLDASPYNIKDLENAIAVVARGGSVEGTARTFGVPASTLRHYVLPHNPYWGRAPAVHKYDSALSDEEEIEFLCLWCVIFASWRVRSLLRVVHHMRFGFSLSAFFALA